MRQPSKEDARAAMKALLELPPWPARAVVLAFLERAERRLPSRLAYDRARIRRRRS